MGVPDVKHDLWSTIARRPTISVRPPVDILQLLGEPEVYQFNVALSVDQNVLRFQIPVNYIFRM